MNSTQYNQDIPDSARTRFNAIVNRIPEDVDKILNLGVPDRGPSKTGFLHDYIIEHTDAEVLGVCLGEETARNINERGYDVYNMDAQYIDFDQKFDVIVVGQIMYHFYNFEEFFSRVERHLTEDGKLIVSNANPHSFVEFRRALFGNVPDKLRLSPENLKLIFELCDSELKLKECELLPATEGGVSGLLWKMKIRRIGAPKYVATIE